MFENMFKNTHLKSEDAERAPDQTEPEFEQI